MIYGDVFDRLERDGVRYVVVGGVAIRLRGYERETRDLDLVVDAAPAEALRATQSLWAAGFVPAIPLPLSMLTVLRMLDGAGRAVDVFARFPIPFEELWSGSERLRFGETTVRVASVADLIREKRYQGRPQDLRDVEGLLAAERLRAGRPEP
jgi:hypothetical protein